MGEVIPRVQEELVILKAQQLEIETSIASIERQIYERETSYLEDTPHGNIVKGWEGFLDKPIDIIKQNKKDALLKKPKILEEDRWFSGSSDTGNSAFGPSSNALLPDSDTKDSSAAATGKKKSGKLGVTGMKGTGKGKLEKQGKALVKKGRKRKRDVSQDDSD